MDSFDWRTYLSNYKDLQDLGLNSRKKAYNHWLTYGKEEGRTSQTIKSFLWQNYIYNYPELNLGSMNAAWEHWKYHGIREGKTDKSIVSELELTYTEETSEGIIYLVTSYSIQSIAFHFQRLLKQIVSMKVEVIYSLSQAMCDRSREKDLFIIINCDTERIIIPPKKFIFYQIEQGKSGWFTPSYRALLDKSQVIWDFCMKHYELYSDQPSEKVYYMPMPLCLEPDLPSLSYDNCVYDILFYGSENARRQSILSTLLKRYNIFVGFGVVGKTKEELIQKSKIIINLHYYEDCALETARLNEILLYDKLIISEKPSSRDVDNFGLYQDCVVWTDEINNNIFDTIDYYLQRDHYLSKLENIRENKIILEENIKEILYDNLLEISNCFNIFLITNLEMGKSYKNKNIKSNKKQVIKSIESNNTVLEVLVEPAEEAALEAVTEEVALEPLVESVIESVPEHVTEVALELALEHPVESVIESVPEHVTEVALELALEHPVEPVIESVPEPLAEPVMDSVPEPLAEEPLAEEPLAEEPLAEEPLAEEPLAEEPLAEESTVEPVIESVPEPLAEEPLAEESTVEPVMDSVPEPLAEEPLAEESVIESVPEHVTEVALEVAEVTELAVEPLVESVIESVPEHVTEVALEPTVGQVIEYDIGVAAEPVIEASLEVAVEAVIDPVLYQEAIKLPEQFNTVFTYQEISQDVFDWRAYLANYKDLQSLGLNSRKKAYHHWITYGKKDGKTCQDMKSFDSDSYLQNYADLGNGGIVTREAAWFHWKNNGVREGRTDKPFELFDWNTYLDANTDLRNAGIVTKEAAWDHWKYYGIKQGRTLEKKVIQPIVVQTEVTVQKELIPVDHRNYTYIIFNHQGGGGSQKYVDDIVKHYKDHVKYVYIKDDNQLRNIEFRKKDIIFIQYLLDTNIQIQSILDIQKKYGCKIIISVHDCYWLHSTVVYTLDQSNYWQNGYLEENISISSEIKNLFDAADQIIHPSRFTWTIFEKYFSTHNFRLVHHNDLHIVQLHRHVPVIVQQTITIGVLHYYSIYKGKEYIELLRSKFNNYKGYLINWIIAGVTVPLYKENEFQEYITKYNINCLTFLNKWGETWCYTLTKALQSGLPILYNNIGSFRERIPSDQPHYMKVYETEQDQDPAQLYRVFEQMMDYIIVQNESSKKMIYNNFYDELFLKKTAIVICNDTNQPHHLEELDQPYSKQFNCFYITNQSDVSFRNIEVIYEENLNSTFYKTQLHTLEQFSIYDYIVFLEPSISIDYPTISKLIKQISEKDSEIGIYRDTTVSTLKDEYGRCCSLEIYQNQDILKQVRDYSKSQPFTIYDTNVIVYKKSSIMTDFMDKWWKEIQQYGSHLNLSFSYVLHHHTVPFTTLTEPIKKINLIQKKIDINQKINGIDHITWINLDRSTHRKCYMETLLTQVHIPNTRISAIDAISYDVKKYNQNLTPYETACTLSHIKAIHSLKQLSGEYFMICEDDINFDQSYLFKESLTEIIRDAPPFDVLQIFKTWYRNLPGNYVKWSDYFDRYNSFISGTVCYIIHKSAVNKICSMVSYDSELDTFNFHGCALDLADCTMYQHLNTYVYNYNYVSTLNQDSSIHPDHLSKHKDSAAFQLYQIYNKLFSD